MKSFSLLLFKKMFLLPELHKQNILIHASFFIVSIFEIKALLGYNFYIMKFTI